MRMLEDGEQFSLRAVAREAGVSPTAPDRHFTDRDALESALATQGLRELTADLAVGGSLPPPRRIWPASRSPTSSSPCAGRPCSG